MDAGHLVFGLAVLVAGGLLVSQCSGPGRLLRRGFEWHGNIRAPRNLVWTLFLHAHGPGSWRPKIVAITDDPQCPDLVTHHCAHGGKTFPIVFRILDALAGEFRITRCEMVGDMPLPLGERSFSACRLTEIGDRTRMDVREEGEFASWWSFVFFALAQRRAYACLRRQAEAEYRKVLHARKGFRRPARSRAIAGLRSLIDIRKGRQTAPTRPLIAGSAIAIGLIAVLWGWQYGALLFALLTIMEYGHAVAMRRAGERPSIIALLPFVGGAMAINARPTTTAGDAYRALSGPAVLSALVVVLAGIGFVAGEGAFADNIRLEALIAAGVVAIFLLPFYPLNGGWLFGILRSGLPHEVFIVPAVVASSIALAWSVATGALFAALLSAALVFELVKPAHDRVVADGSLTARRALAVTLAYGGLNLIAHSIIASYIAA